MEAEKARDDHHIIFPAQKDQYEMMGSIGELKNILRTQFRKRFPGKGEGFFYLFKHGASGDRKVYARCKHCSSQLSWRLEAFDQYRLHRWNNSHGHRLTPLPEDEITAYLFTVSPHLTLRQMKEQVCSRFKCPTSRFYAIVRRVCQVHPRRFPNLKKAYPSKEQKILEYLEEHQGDDPLLHKDTILANFHCSATHFDSIAQKFRILKGGSSLGNRKDLKLMRYLQTLPETEDLNGLRHVEFAKRELQIAQPHFQEIVRRMQEESTTAATFFQLQQTLSQSEFICQKYYGEQAEDTLGYPDLLVITTEDMIRYYQHCGGVIRVQVAIQNVHTSKYQPKGSAQPGMQYKVAYISGRNSYNNLLIYSLLILSNIDAGSVRRAMDTFFSLMRDHSQSGLKMVVITDYQEYYAYALQQVSRPCCHLYAPSSVLDHLKHLSPTSFDQCLELSSSTSSSQYQRMYGQLKNSVRHDANQLQDICILDSLAHKCCLARLESTMFVGLSMEPDPHQTKDRVRQTVPPHPEYALCVMPLLQHCRQVNAESYQRVGSQSVLLEHRIMPLNKEIERCRQELCAEAYKTLQTNLMRSMHLNVISNSKGVAVVQEHDQEFTLSWQSSAWACQCGYWSKTMLPCSHELKVCSSYWEQVGIFWKTSPAHIMGQ